MMVDSMNVICWVEADLPASTSSHIRNSIVEQEQFTMNDEQSASTTDTTFNLISVIYHSLQAVDTFHTYQRDADETGDTRAFGPASGCYPAATGSGCQGQGAACPASRPNQRLLTRLITNLITPLEHQCSSGVG